MKKKINIFLFLLLLILWCLVIYKYFGASLFPNDDNLQAQSTHSHVKLKLQQKDTFRLLPIVKNPFLRENRKIVDKPVVYNKAVKTQKTGKPSDKIVTPVVFPKIEYYGYIQSHGQVSQLVLLKINHKVFKLRLGQVQDDVTVLNLNKDSVLVSFMKLKRSIKKN